MKYICADNGDVFDAINDADLVTQMRTRSYDKAEDNKTYMLNYSRRTVVYNNQDIRATNENDFVNDLLRLNHISILGNK
jgi:hypothetical protein